MEKIVFRPYDVQSIERLDQNFNEIQLWGLDRDSKPILCRVQDYRPSFYVEMPPIVGGKKFKWKKSDVETILDFANYILKSSDPEFVFILEGISLHKKLHYYQSDEDQVVMARLSFSTKKAMYEGKSTFRRKVMRNIETDPGVFLRDLTFAIHEDEIAVERKFFTEIKTQFTQWVAIHGEIVRVGDERRVSYPGNEEFPVTEVIVSYKKIKPIAKETTESWTTSPRTVSFDIETYSDNHRKFPNENHPKHTITHISLIYQQLKKKETKKRICLVLGECNGTEKGIVEQFDNEKKLIHRFFEMIRILDPDIIIGYNILGFDNKYILARLNMRSIVSELPNMGRIIGGKTQVDDRIWQSSGCGSINTTMFLVDGRIMIDLLPIVKRGYKLPKYTLDVVALHFLKKGKHDVKPKDMFIAYENNQSAILLRNKIQKNEEDISEEMKEEASRLLEESKKEMTRVTEYCLEDSDLVLELFEMLNSWIALNEESSINGITIVQIFTRGQTIRAKSLIYNVAHLRGIVIDKKNRSDDPYGGAYVFEPDPNIHDFLITLDFASLYPSILMAYNICFTTLVKKQIEDSKVEILEFDEEIDEDFVKAMKLRPISIDDDDKESDLFKEEKGSFGDSPKKKTTKTKKTMTVHRIHKWIKPEVYKGVLPEIERGLVDNRNLVRKQKAKIDERLKLHDKGRELIESEEEIDQLRVTSIVLESRQLNLKVTANSIYGFLGNVLKEAASSITAMGRILIHKVEKYLKEEKNAEIVYGDSVVGDTPIIIRENGKVKVKRIDELTFSEEKGDKLEEGYHSTLLWDSDQKSTPLWDSDRRFTSSSKGMEKKSFIPSSLEVWDGNSFAKVKRVISHFYRGEIYKIVTEGGEVECTAHHSLLTKEGKEICPKDVKEGDSLLHYDSEKLMKILSEITIPTDEKCPERWDEWGNTHFKIYDSSKKEKAKFELYRNAFLLLKNGTLPQKGDTILEKIKIRDNFEGEVFDLETESHHFAVGPGNLVVHNTDSIMIKLPGVNQYNCNTIGKELAEEVSRVIGRAPLRMEFEKAMRAIIFKKKKYAAYLYSDSGKFKIDENGKNVMLYRGIPLARRDNCKWIRDTYYELLINILDNKSILSSFNIIYEKILSLMKGEVPLKQISIIKTLGESYKATCNSSMKVFGEELFRLGKPVKPGERLEFVIVKEKVKNEKLGYRQRLIDDFLADNEGEEVDYFRYIDKLLKNPIDQMFSVGYKDILNSLIESGKMYTFHQIYLPKCDIKRKCNLVFPVKMICKMIKDYMKMPSSEKEEIDLFEYLEYHISDVRDLLQTIASREK